MKEPILIVTVAIIVMVFMGSLGFVAANQRAKTEIVCRQQMLDAGRSTDDIVRVCLGK